VNWFEAVQANVKRHLAKDGSFFLNIKEHMEDGERHMYVLELLLSLRKEWGWLHIDTFAWTHQGFPISVKTRFKNQWEPIYHLGHTHKIKPINFDVVGLEVSKSQIKGSKRYQEGYREPKTESGYSDAKNSGNLSKEFEYTRPGNVLNINLGAGGQEYRIQSAAYPVALPEFFIKAFSDECDRVYDPFGGSGTTAVAAHRNNRRSLLMEISPKYCDLILTRLERETGEIAKAC
jgi:DNA modification methylase